MKKYIYIAPFIVAVSFASAQNDDESWKVYQPDSSISENEITPSDSAITTMITEERTLLEFPSKTGTGKLQEFKDVKIDALSEEIGAAGQDGNVKIYGYRIQASYSQDLSAVQQKKAQFLRSFEDIEAYIDYEQPNYYLRIGDFRTKLDAQKFEQDLKSLFEFSTIIYTKINLPKL